MPEHSESANPRAGESTPLWFEKLATVPLIRCGGDQFGDHPSHHVDFDRAVIQNHNLRICEVKVVYKGRTVCSQSKVRSEAPR